MLRATSLFGRFDDFLGNDTTVGLCDLGLFHLARNALRDQVPQAKADLGHLDRSNGGREVLVAILGQN
jgi:hypothetical protein